jgi:hypothetical protein
MSVKAWKKETELVAFELVEHWDVSFLNDMISENIKCGYVVQGEPYCYTPADGSNRVNHVVPMAHYREVVR